MLMDPIHLIIIHCTTEKYFESKLLESKISYESCRENQNKNHMSSVVQCAGKKGKHRERRKKNEKMQKGKSF